MEKLRLRMADEFRLPYKEKHIKDLKNEDIKVAILGTITKKENGRLSLDDGDKSIMINLETDLQVGSFVKVFGNLLAYDEGFEIQGHFLKNLDNTDKLLYKKAMNMIINSK